MEPNRSSAAIIGGNDDILLETLLRLPIKSLIRFQVVSKRLQSLISNPAFSHLYALNRHPKPRPSLLLRMGLTSRYFICHPTIRRLTPFIFRFRYMKILQSCNGLLLLECQDSASGVIEFYVFNPTTGKSRNLSLSEANCGIFLVFDPLKSPHYKVVCFRRSYLCTRALVYDSETHTWNEGAKFVGGPLEFSNGVYCNDGIYFVRSYGSSYYLSLMDGNIYSIPNPPPGLPSPLYIRNYYTMESNGYLHSVLHISRANKSCLYVFEFRVSENVGRWFLKYFVDLDLISATFARGCGVGIRFLGLVRGDGEEDSIMMLHVRGKILIYRLFDEAFEVLIDFSGEDYFSDGPLQFEFKDAHQFIESLAPV